MKRLVPVGLLLAAALAGCSGAAATPAAKSTGAGSSQPATSSASATAAPRTQRTTRAPGPTVRRTETPTASPTPQPTAGAVRPRISTGPLVRDGKTARPDVTAAPQPIHHEVSYSDGVTVKIAKVSHETETGQGAGMRPGQAVTVFNVRITNNSAKRLDLNQVVVGLTYDGGRMQAQPAYVGDTNDFSGWAEPGASVATSYAFTIPSADLGDVTVTVDFDGSHSAATFTGSVR